MAVTSAWAVGSLSAVTRLTPSKVEPSAVTIMAPKGPPLLRTLAVASRIDLAKYCSAVTVVLMMRLPFAGKPVAVQDQ